MLLYLCLVCFGFPVDQQDGLHNLGRVPLISEWEIRHPTEQFGRLSLELQTLLNKTEEFQQKGKFDLVEKMYHRIIEDSGSHPDILRSYGEYLEWTVDEPLNAFHYYVYSLHQCCDSESTIHDYYRVLPTVHEYDRQLFSMLDNQDSQLETVDLSSDNALEVIHEVQKRKRIEHIYHTNAIEGNSLGLEVARAIVETGSPPEDGSYHLSEVNEIWGVLEAFDYSAFVALESYQSIILDISDGDFVSLATDTHQSLLTIPSVVRDQSDHEDMLESMTGSQAHLNFIVQIYRMILGSVNPEIAGLVVITQMLYCLIGSKKEYTGVKMFPWQDMFPLTGQRYPN